ncbi:uncharacterized protein Fot_30125 [Forsythia ovata]|uniref:Uncharacterized protein n=1 Tax=Forsythia ovata TaxID=205694 RepID=A0ABD1TTV0_9LAMI
MGSEELTIICNTKPISPATAASPASNNAVKIIQKAIKYLLENKKFMLQVFLLVLTPFWVLVLLHSIIVGPLMEKVEDSYEKSSLNRQDLISLLALEIPFAVAFSLVLLFGSVVSIFASALIHQGASLSLQEILLRSRSTWKKTITSGLTVSILMTTIISLIVIAVYLTPLLGVLAALTYPYLASICNLGLVISTVEDDFPGTKGLFRAQEFVKKNKFQGYLLMLMLILLSIPIYLAFYVISTDDDDQIGHITRFAFLFVATVLFCLTIFFNNIVYTLLYLELKSGYHLVHNVACTGS